MLGNKTKGNIALLFTAIIWGSGFIVQKLGMEALPPLAFNGIRQLCAGIVLLPLMLVNLKRTGYLARQYNSPEKRQRKIHDLAIGGSVCGLMLMLGSNMQQIGLQTVSAGKSGFITAIYIVLVPIFSIFFGKKLNLKTVMCCVLAMSGFALLSLRGGLGNVTMGDWITLLSAVAFSFQIIAVNQFVNQHNDIVLSVLQMLISGGVTVLVSLIVESYSWSNIAQAAPLLLYSTMMPTAMGFTLQIVGQKYTDATTASFLMSLESVFSVIFGAIFLHESMEHRELLGCALIFLANVIVQMPDRPGRSRNPQDSSRGE